MFTFLGDRLYIPDRVGPDTTEYHWLGSGRPVLLIPCIPMVTFLPPEFVDL